MEEHKQWHDPLLLTDVSRQQQTFSHDISAVYPNFETLEMRNSERQDLSVINPASQSLEMGVSQGTSVLHQSLEIISPQRFTDLIKSDTSNDLSVINPPSQSLEMGVSQGTSVLHQSLEIISPQRFTDLIKSDTSNGRTMLGFSLTSPDLVVCTGSPDIPKPNSAEKERDSSVVLSLEEGINGVEAEASRDIHESSKFSSFWHTSEDTNGSEVTGDLKNLQGEYDYQKQELIEAKKAIEQLKKENEVKSNECQQALKSLHELQSELMRKSMHVGSLAFAVEGQVKEKGKWLSSLSGLKRKLKILKLDQMKLSEEALKYKDCLGEIDELRSIIQVSVTQPVSDHDELKRKISEGEKQRKELYNKVLELKGNIRVFCRCRPLHAEEIASGARVAVDFESAKDGELAIRSNSHPRKTFKFDSVFSPQADQADVFEDTAPFATSVLDGYNVCIFAYGQTGTGKTFTMEGTHDTRGVNYRTLAELFRIISERQKLFRYEIRVSVLEVYNEQIRDLLASGTQPNVASKRLEIKQSNEGVLHVPGLVEAHVSNISEVWEVLKTGSNSRAVGATNANEHSSRSHCIHCVMVKGENLLNGECIRSKLWLVDLAGSERIAKTEAQGERLKEAQNINRSLSALGDVISSLANKSSHVPFRNSKLTHLLQDSLGGDSKALMFVQVSPNEDDLSETICSLNFASRVKGVELGPAKKQLDNTEYLRYKQLVEKTKQEAKLKDVQIKKMEEQIHNLEAKVKEKDQKNKNLQEKMKELEAQLLVERKLARQHVGTKIAEQQQQQQLRQQFEDQNSAPIRPPLVTKTLKDIDDFTSNTANLPQLSDHDNRKTPSCFLPEKENNPEIGELPPPSKKTGRASLCPTAQRIPIASNPRRNSLIPLPSTPMTTVHHPSEMLPLPPSLEETKEDRDEVENLFSPELDICSPIAAKSGAKKVNSVLRRSLQKKMKSSPLQPHLKKGGVNVGVEKVRVSIGSRGRSGQRVLLGNARRTTAREAKKQSQKEKERGWNF